MYNNARSGIKALRSSAVLNTIAGAVYCAAAMFTLFVGRKSADSGVVLAAFFILLAAAAGGVAALFLQMKGLARARRDEPLFGTAFTFVIVGIICTVVSVFTAGTFSNIFSGVNEVATLLASLYTVLGVYSLALGFDNKRVQSAGKVTTVALAVVFALAVAGRIISVFTPAIDFALDAAVSVLNLFGYAVYLTYISRAAKMCDPGYIG